MEKMKKKAQLTTMGFILGMLFILVVGLGLTGNLKNPFKGSGSIGLATADLDCPDDGITTLTLSVKNMGNTSGDETFDMGGRLVGDNGHKATVADTTEGSYSLNCGEVYTLKGLSASGAEGDSAEFSSIVDGNAVVNADGEVEFLANKNAMSIIVGGVQHDVLEFRAKDVINDAFMYDDAENNANDYDTDGVNFKSTTNNETDTAIGSGGEFHVMLYYRPTTAEDTVFGDIDGYYVLVEAPSTIYSEPTVKVDGVTYSNMKDSLNADEKLAYNGYEYVYHVPHSVKKNAETALDFQIFALSGVNPADANDMEIDLASRGAYASTSNSNVVQLGSVKDDSSQTVVHTLMDVGFDVS